MAVDIPVSRGSREISASVTRSSSAAAACSAAAEINWHGGAYRPTRFLSPRRAAFWNGSRLAHQAWSSSLEPQSAAAYARQDPCAAERTRHRLVGLSFAGSPFFVTLKGLSETTNQALSIFPFRNSPMYDATRLAVGECGCWRPPGCFPH
jgi:hypothetical protein